MATWPATLPQDILFDGYSATLPDGTIRTEMSAGPDFARQRFTAAPEPYSAQILVDLTQRATFINFYVTTLAHGALEFDWKHPVTGTAAKIRFRETPEIEPVSHNRFRVSMELQVEP